jgi:Zn-dependent protease
LISQLLSDPAAFFQDAIYSIPALLITLTCHEWAHAYVAYRCGDPTARMLGRLSLNPTRHLDPLGTLMMVFAGFGWAKPVPVNPRNYRHRIPNDIMVSLAGIVTNLTLFLVALFLSLALRDWQFSSYAAANLGWVTGLITFLTTLATMNLMVAIFNLLPIPPLDGYHVFNDLILRGRLNITPQMAQAGIMIVMFLSFATDYLDRIMSFLANNIITVAVQAYFAIFG